MRKNNLVIGSLLTGIMCCSVSGEAISSGNETSFQIFSAPEARISVTAEETLTGAQKVYGDFIKTHTQDKKGMVLGRGNVQGVDERRITIPELKKLSWLFVDPGETEGRFYNNPQDVTQGNALVTTWPVDFSINDVFDAVVFDDGVLQYIGDDGVGLRLGQEFVQKFMELVITKTDGTTVSKKSFEFPYQFQDWLIANRPEEFVRLEAQYWPQRQAAREKQRKTLEKGLLNAYLALKRGGMLIVPIDGSIDGIDLVSLWSISDADLVRHSIKDIDYTLGNSPVLPHLAEGMGADHGDFYSVIRK